jgi:hypothetical protein
VERKRDSVDCKRDTPNVGSTYQQSDRNPREVDSSECKRETRYVSVGISVERKRDCPYQAGRALERVHTGDCLQDYG